MRTLYAVLLAALVGFGGVATADDKAAPDFSGEHGFAFEMKKAAK